MDEIASPLSGYVRRHVGAAATVAAGGAAGAPTSESASSGGDRRFELLRSVGEECQTEAELKTLLEKKPNFFLYDGFEPSGRMHIAQGVFKSINVNKCTQAGGTFIFWVADWFALMNDKMGGDLEKIKTVGHYLVEVWKAAGMDMSRVKFLWSSDEINANAKSYWEQALHIAARTNMTRIKKCCQIMGRADENKLTAAQILYPIMQCTDIFFLKADICQLGVDQRKVNMLAREYAGDPAAKTKSKPIILSHHMLYGLKAGQSKMSKSDPDSAIFMEDTKEDVERKIKNAYCPTQADAKVLSAVDDEMSLVKDELKNPCLDYLKYILFSNDKFVFTVGDKSYTTYEESKAAFLSGAISEDVLKDRLIVEINKLLEPVRQHFQNDPVAKDLLGKITQWKRENLEVMVSNKKLKVIDPKNGPVFAVFAPLPREFLHFDAVVGVLQRLQACPKGSQAILWLEDWSAFALGKVGGSSSAIKAFYDLLLHGLTSLAPELMKRVRVCWQQELILSGASEYWISVINAGRGSNLGDVTKALAEGETLDFAGQVVSTLMHAGDVMGLCEDGNDVVLCCDKSHEQLHNFAAGYCKGRGVGSPSVQLVAAPSLRLLSEEEGGLEVDVNIMLTDKDIEVNKKIKKAFCQPQNVTHCPLISWIAELLKASIIKEFTVLRKPDNGGDKTYTQAQPIWDDFESGALHPGDLKPSVSKMFNAVLECTRPGLKDNDVLKKAQKELADYLKSLSKKK
jgi:tyrosyl-tRNA synthetase